MKPIYLIAIITLSLFSCKQEKGIDEGDIAYLGGEVISPIEDFVVLKQSDKVIDTISLDDNNRFLYKFKNLKPDLYTFWLKSNQGNEFQFVLLEPNDSIIFRLNTIDFDESLVFTGQGAKKNNYLINLFLNGEKDERIIYKSFKLPVEDFIANLDSLKSVKQKKLDRFLEKNDNANYTLFNKVAQANLDYCYYTSKEFYPFVHFGNKNIKKIESLPEDFYDYRKDINYNDEFLKEYFAYFDFLRRHINNLALGDYFKHSENCVFNDKALSYNLAKLNLIDSLIEQPNIKNRLLYHSVITFLNKNNNSSDCEHILESYLKKSSNEMNKNRIKKFAYTLKIIEPGNSMPEIKIADVDDNTFEIKKLINKPSVIYFWTQANKWHFKEAHKKVQALKDKYPNINFIAINIDHSGTLEWKDLLKKYKFSSDNEYQFVDSKKAESALALQAINKVFLVNSYNKIVNNKANLFSKDFEKQLLQLSKK